MKRKGNGAFRPVTLYIGISGDIAAAVKKALPFIPDGTEEG